MKRKRENDENDSNDEIKKRKIEDDILSEQGPTPEQVLKKLSENIEKYKNGGSYFLRGCTYRMMRKNNLAIDDFSMAIKMEPKNPAYYYHRGKVYFLQEQYELSFRDFSQAIKLDSKHADSYFERGNVYKKMKKYDLALQNYSQAIKIAPIDHNVVFYYTARGKLFKKRKQNDLALKDYTQAIKVARNFRFEEDSFLDFSEKPRQFLIKKVKKFKRMYILETYYNLSKLYYQMTNYLLSIKYESLAIDIIVENSVYSGDVPLDFDIKVEKLKKKIFTKNISKW